MINFHGNIEGPRWRAVVRLGLRAHGFDIDRDEYESALACLWSDGCKLRDEYLPRHLPGFADRAEYIDLPRTAPDLWQQLAWMAGSGWQQAQLLGRLNEGTKNPTRAATQLGALFNIAIVLLDHVADQRQLGGQMFELLTYEALGEIFLSEERAHAALAAAHSNAIDPALRILIALIDMCCAQGWEIYRSSQNHGAWSKLASLIARLYQAQRSVSEVSFPSASDLADLTSSLEVKSVVPSEAVLQISVLAGIEPEPAKSGAQVAQALGRLYCVVDDLVDLIDDCNAGAPSSLLSNLVAEVRADDRSYASDADVCAVAHSACEDVLTLLSGIQEAGSSSVEEEEAVIAAAAYARFRVAAWVSWSEEPQNGSPTVDAASAIAAPYGDMVLSRATAFLLTEQREGYRAAIHHMRFPRQTSEGLRWETHPALLFQRAIIVDALLDAREAGSAVSDAVICSEAMQILRQQHRQVAGGWSYIPEVPELPPDADDLAIVLRVLNRVAGATGASLCDQAIELSIDAAREDGGFPTAILDPLGRSETDRAIRAYLWVGDWGVHPEVVAHLLYALILYDRERYWPAVDRAISYLESVQDARGFWESKWYSGPYYGTYRAVSVLARAAPESTALHGARRFLLMDQSEDGSFGDSDPLSTALGLLALMDIGPHGPTDRTALAVEHLRRSQQSDGGWPASTWGSFRTVLGTEEHGSRAITTAFCVKAMAAARGQLELVRS